MNPESTEMFPPLSEDATEQQKVMLELTRREEQLRVLFETSRAGIILVDPAGVITVANGRMAEMFGCTMEELIGSRYPDHVHPEHFSQGDDRMRKLIAGEIDHVAIERRYIRTDGSDFWGYLSGRRHVDAAGNFISLVGHITDITKRKQFEDALLEEKNKSEAILAALGDALSIQDRNYRILYQNDILKGIIGSHPGELCYKAYEGRDDVCEGCPVEATFRDGGIHCTVRSVTRNGVTSQFEITTSPLRDSSGAITAGIELIRDITERSRVEEQLKASEENYRCFAGLTSDYVHKCSRTGAAPFRVLWMGGAVGSITGFTPEEISEFGCWLPLVHPDDRQAVAAHLYGLVPGDVKRMEFRLVTKQQDIRWISETSRCESGAGEGELILFGASTDITERKRGEGERQNMEKQLLHAQKLESLGVLAGGIAHDFNNILTSIIGNADLALMRINKESPAADNLHRIEKAAVRAADLAKQMLAYSGKGKFVVENLDLNILLEEMLHMLEVSISKKAVLRLNLHQPLPPVEADATQMHQIIMNLVINASEAIGDRSGVIAITTGCMDCDRSYLNGVWLDENLTDGLYVYLEIADSGCGMDKETMAKLFDPFFTTKFTGRGLGMAAVLGIVRGHKGAIKVYSEPGKGTTFKILLPASGLPADQFNCDSRPDEWHGSGTVLLVDDEETIRGIGAEMLKELGFTTITAADGLEAVEIFKSTPGIDFVILDLTMPHMDGELCFRELRQLDPLVKVIMSSGYNEQEVTQKFVGKGLAGFIQKPYRLSTLQEVIRSVAG